jgi:hypothetical protein
LWVLPIGALEVTFGGVLWSRKIILLLVITFTCACLWPTAVINCHMAKKFWF